MNTITRIQDVTIERVMSAYKGHPGCMCGCKGRYSYNPVHRELGGKNRGYEVELKDCSKPRVSAILARMQELEEAGTRAEINVDHAYVEDPETGKALALYFVPEES